MQMTTSPPSTMPGIAKLHLRVRAPTSMGEELKVCGWLAQMGGWKAEKALLMKTRADEYPFWTVSIDVLLSEIKETIKYKYLIVGNGYSKWEDAIADRTLVGERKPGGTLAAGLHTHVDDGEFNRLQRVCTYVRDTHERQAPKSPVLGSGGGGGGVVSVLKAAPQIPAGMQLVSMEQVRQWEVRVAELEEECLSLRHRASCAETTVDALQVDLEEEKRQNEEIMAQMKFVEDLLDRMKKIESQVSTLEQTKEVLINRSESLSDLSKLGQKREHVADGIEDGLKQAANILGNLDKQLPKNGEKVGIRY